MIIIRYFYQTYIFGAYIKEKSQEKAYVMIDTY